MPAARPLPDWPRAHGSPPVGGVLRVQPEDFRVEELPLVEPAGDGTHLWLELRKRNANTSWVAGELARAAGIPPRDVGYAGMKDRRAVTTQWFSLNLQQAPAPDPASWHIPDVEILQASRHPRKLQRGALRGNRFRIVVRDLRGDRDALAERLQVLRERGLPNYFGEQRFGHGGRNVARAADWLERGGRIRRSERSILISAMRSFLFNQVLATRVRQGGWDRLLDGEVAQLDGRRSLFSCRLPDPELERRCAAGAIHPTGPLPGRGGLPSERAAAAAETAALDGYAAWIAALEGVGAEAARRSLRVIAADLSWAFGDDGLLLEFSLPPGAYATALLRELVSIAPGTISESA
jgi:tRNA pseudouridine13 synthase